jgi:type I restriction enzyme R subunit
MSASNFQFLAKEWPDLLAFAAKAEALTYGDPRASCFYSRRTFEQAVDWLYLNNGALKSPSVSGRPRGAVNG